MRCFLFIWYFISFTITAEPEPRFVTEVLPPLQTMEQGELSGIHTDKVKAVMKGAGLQDTAIEIYPWARAYKIALQRKNTFIFSMVRTAEREDKFIWVHKISEDNFSFFAAPPIERYQITKLSDAKKWHTAVSREDLAHQHLLRVGFKNNHHLFIGSNIDSTFQTFFSGKVDLIVTTNEILQAMSVKHGQNANDWSLVLEIPQLSAGFYLAANIDTEQALVERVRNAFKRRH